MIFGKIRRINIYITFATNSMMLCIKHLNLEYLAFEGSIIVKLNS